MFSRLRSLFEATSASRSYPLDRPLIFITGAPRSGTSMVSKIIDAHPDVAILMEQVLENRRPRWIRAEFWNSESALRREVAKIYARLEESIVGNKVLMPHQWTSDDILFFCMLFADFKIVFVVRDPVAVCLSRFSREDKNIFTEESKRRSLFDFRSRALTFTSSWRQSIESMRRLRDGYPENIYVLYYEDFCENFDEQSRKLFAFLGVPWHEQVARWYQVPHHNRSGELQRDLVYPDRPVAKVEAISDPSKWPDGLAEALPTIERETMEWRARRL